MKQCFNYIFRNSKSVEIFTAASYNPQRIRKGHEGPRFVFLFAPLLRVTRHSANAKSCCLTRSFTQPLPPQFELEGHVCRHVRPMFGLCLAYVGPMLGLCWAYVGPSAYVKPWWHVLSQCSAHIMASWGHVGGVLPTYCNLETLSPLWSNFQHTQKRCGEKHSILEQSCHHPLQSSIADSLIEWGAFHCSHLLPSSWSECRFYLQYWYIYIYIYGEYRWTIPPLFMSRHRVSWDSWSKGRRCSWELGWLHGSDYPGVRVDLHRRESQTWHDTATASLIDPHRISQSPFSHLSHLGTFSVTKVWCQKMKKRCSRDVLNA